MANDVEEQLISDGKDDEINRLQSENAELKAQLESSSSSSLTEAFRNAKPSFLQNQNRRIEGRYGDTFFKRTDFPEGVITRQPRQPFFPETQIEDISQAAAASVPNIAFILSNASTTTAGVVTRKVKVFDGKINGVFPSGMGFNNYVLTLSTPADSLIYAGTTFDPRTLELNSRFLDVKKAADFPESRVESDSAGFLYWLLGFTYIDAQGAFKIVNVKTGDINFQLVYGSQNGQPALLPVNSDPGWLDLAFGP